jgi:hypothetical protein
MELEIFSERAWQMSSGERAAVEGLLGQLRPALAIEIGTAEGAGARRIAAHAAELHCFDIGPPTLELPTNVVVHTGDSHELLPRVLAELAESDRNVDFVMVDGDHSATGVRQDIEDLLDSPALARTVILIHDIANEQVRAGLEAVHFAAWPKVAHVHLDWIPGQLFAEPGLEDELWYGLGLVIVDSARPAYRNGEVFQRRYFPAAPLLVEGRRTLRENAPVERPSPQAEVERRELEWELVEARDLLADARREVAEAQQRLAAANEEIARLLESASWRLTRPLRWAKRRMPRREG